MSTAHRFWYETVDDTSLRQGDIFIDLICYWLSQDLEPESPAPPVSKATGTWIVAQASCDMEARGLERVVVLDVFPASRRTLRIAENAPEKELKKRLEVIRSGAYPRRFILLTRDTVILQTTAYTRFEDFAERLRMAVHTVLAESEHDRLGVVHRVGLRYIDVQGSWSRCSTWTTSSRGTSMPIRTGWWRGPTKCTITSSRHSRVMWSAKRGSWSGNGHGSGQEPWWPGRDVSIGCSPATTAIHSIQGNCQGEHGGRKIWPAVVEDWRWHPRRPGLAQFIVPDSWNSK